MLDRKNLRAPLSRYLFHCAVILIVALIIHDVRRLMRHRNDPRPVLTIVDPVPLWGVPACHRMAAGVNAGIARCEGALQGCQDAARIPEDCHNIVARLGCDWDHGRAQLLKDCPGISGAGVYK